MSVVFLIRHAHSEWTADEARSLSKPGTLSAQQLAVRLGGEPIVAIYSSPSRRAVDTVAPLAEQLHLDIYMVENLRERDVPAMRMSEFETMIREAWFDPDSSPGGGGESNIDAQARGVAVMRRIIERHPLQHVVISTHGNLMALIMNALRQVVRLRLLARAVVSRRLPADFRRRETDQRRASLAKMMKRAIAFLIAPLAALLPMILLLLASALTSACRRPC